MKLELALGGVALLLIPLVACEHAPNDTSRTSSPVPTPTGTSIPPSRPTRPPPTPPPPDEDFVCPADVPLTDSDLDKEVGWKPGAASPGSCSATDLQTITANFKNTNIRTYFDLGQGISETCFACAFSKDTDASWGPIVGTAENNGETGFVNLGACYGAIEGAACGKAIQYESFCSNVACNECAVTSSEREQCVTKASESNGMCAPFTDKRTTSCPSWQLNVKSCGDVQLAIKTLCGTP